MSVCPDYFPPPETQGYFRDVFPALWGEAFATGIRTKYMTMKKKVKNHLSRWDIIENSVQS